MAARLMTIKGRQPRQIFLRRTLAPPLACSPI
jgi:hypothetical protein